MKQFIRTMLASICCLFALGCDQQGNLSDEPGLSKLAKGVSTEGDVRTAMGRPEMVREEDSGERVLEYPKGPNGVRTWMFDIGQDGKLKDWRQVLTEDNFSRIQPGMSMDQVRRLLGKPRSTVQFRLKKEEVWDWLYETSEHNKRLLNVHFDLGTQAVTKVTTSDDPEVRS